MLGFIKDISIFFTAELPPSFSRDRIILNFFRLYIYSLFSKIWEREGDHYQPLDINVDIESDIWRNLCSIITLYVKYISPKYMMQTYIIRGVATSWHSQEYIDHLNENFTQNNIEKIDPSLIQSVEKTANVLAQEFVGLDYAVVKHWLLTYQFGLSELYDDKQSLQKKLEDCLVIEIGPGTGSNAAVHASISKKGVYLFDIPPMLEIQKLTIDRLRKKLEMSDVSYFHDPEELIRAAKGLPYIVVSYWAFTEFSQGLRSTLEPLLEGAEFSFFACNSKFEETQNSEYFSDLGSRLDNKTIKSQPIHWQKYKGHTYVMVR